MGISDFQALISVSRLERYSSVDDYISSVTRASQIQQMLHWVEIGYRNHMHEGIQAAYKPRHLCDSWLTCTCANPPVALNQISAEKNALAKKFLSSSDRKNPNMIIPGLSFGFWVRLLSSANETNIWNAGLHKSFPRKNNRPDLHNRLRRMNLIRNRIAHLEPVDTYSLTQISSESLKLIHLIAPKLDDFMTEEFQRIHKPA